MARIVWTKSEREALRAATYEVFNRPVFFHSLFDAFAIAQRDVLPQDRRREVVPPQVVWVLENEPLEGNLNDYAKSYLSELVAALKQNKPIPTTKKHKRVKEVVNTVTKQLDLQPIGDIALVLPTDGQEEVAAEPETEIKQATAEPDVNISAEDVVQEVSTMLEQTPVAEAVAQALDNSDINLQLMLLVEAVTENTKTVKYLADKLDRFISLQQQQQTIASKDTVTPPPTKVKKPMVLVMNMLPVQFGDVKNEFGEFFDLRSWEGSKGNHQTLKSLVQNSYRIFAHTDHMRHCDDTKVSKMAAGKYVRFSGSTSTLKGLLNDMAQEYWSSNETIHA